MGVPALPLHHVASAVIGIDHPCLAGHFPGNPIVPGVVLVALAERAARGAGAARRLAGVPAVKFLRPVLPGESLTITLDSADGAAVKFVVAVAGVTAAAGSFRFEA